MIDLRKYANSLVSQSAKDLYKDAVNDCACIKHLQAITEKGCGVLEDHYSHAAYDKAIAHAIPLVLAAHVEKYGLDSDSEPLMDSQSDVYTLLLLSLKYATTKDAYEVDVVARQISLELYKNMCKYALPKLQKDITELYEEYYESGEYERQKSEDGRIDDAIESMRMGA